MQTRLYNNLKLSETTIKRRQQIKNMMDEFMDFQWREQSAFENFGAFIINDKKGSLKFYNGPGFSNEYTKPQYDSNGGELVGVNFNKQSISFTIGVYWISIEHYRLLINWLDPLVTNYIIFGFDDKYRYNVKLSKRADSTRWVVGHEMIDGVKTPMYYTELALTFELQGAQCARGINSYEFKDLMFKEYDDFFYTQIETQTSSGKLKTDFIPSDMPTPIECNISLPLYDLNLTPSSKNIIDEVELQAWYDNEVVTLFNVTLTNLTYSNNSLDYKTLHLQYNSENGLLFLKYGDNYDKILTSVNTTDTGNRIVNSFKSNKFLIPGRFDFINFYGTKEDMYENLNKFSLHLIWKRQVDDNLSYAVYDNEINAQMVVYCYPRTNVI